MKGGSGHRLCWQDTPSTGEALAVICACTKRFCGCSKLGSVIGGEEVWETAQEGLFDLQSCNNADG